VKISQTLTSVLAAAVIILPCFAQTPTPPAASAGHAASSTESPNEAERMKQMMEMAKLNENHKVLASLAGNWNYTIKFWMNPGSNAPPQESKGTATTKPIMGGRYFVMDVNGTVEMPGADSKMKNLRFKGMGIDGYDNVKKKFVASWIDNLGTGIAFSEGIYDPATKIFTYSTELEPVPGMKSQAREVVKIVDKDHHVFEWYETQDGREKKTMEINYTRKK
jgi:hypothetical protein